MKALITGTTGLLGVHLIQELQRRELGYEPEVDIREGIRLSASLFNVGGMEQLFVTQASQYAPLVGTRTLSGHPHPHPVRGTGNEGIIASKTAEEH